MRHNNLTDLTDRELLVEVLTEVRNLKKEFEGHESDVKDLKEEVQELRDFKNIHNDLPKVKETVATHSAFIERYKGVVMFFSGFGFLSGLVSVLIQLYKMMQ